MDKQGFYTREEIYSQPEIWQRSMEQLGVNKWDHLPDLTEFDQIYLAGCGSTHYLSIWAALLLQTRTGVCSRPLPASELWLQPDIWVSSTRKTCLLAISRSGTTTETIKAVKHFKTKPGIAIIVITCYPDSDLAQLADSLFPFPAAQEKSIAQTRSFSNMMLGVPFLIQKKIENGLPEKLRASGSELIAQHGGLMKDLANDRGIQRFFFLGSGGRYGLACEAMLKMKEMSLSYSEAYHFLEFRHGPMSMVDEESLVVGLLGDQNRTQELRVLQEMKELGGTILAIGNELKDGMPGWLDQFIPLEGSDLDGFGDVLYLPPLQLLAYERAVGKGLDPDHPHHLDAVVILDE